MPTTEQIAAEELNAGKHSCNDMPVLPEIDGEPKAIVQEPQHNSERLTEQTAEAARGGERIA